MYHIFHMYYFRKSGTRCCVCLCPPKVSAKITFLQSVFVTLLVVLGNFWLTLEFEDRYSKSPSQSLKKTSVTTFINSFISAYDSTAEDLAAKIHQK